MGRFEAGTVVGLRFTTPSGTGLTGADGTFKYRQGETVTFSIGGITLGSAPGAAVISPFTLAGIAAPTTEAGLRAQLATAIQANGAFARTLKIGLLLLALDVDGNPDDGIDLSGRDAELQQAHLDFDQEIYEFIAYSVDLLTADGNVAIPVGSVLIYLYENLGITVAAHARTDDVNDIGDDGVLESSLHVSYAPDGAVTTEFDYDGDGILDQRYTRNFGGLGRESATRTEIDSNDDGAVDIISTTSIAYDMHGRTSLIETADDGNGDGIPDMLGDVAYTWTHGQISAFVQENDYDADGTADWRRSVTLSYGTQRELVAYVSELDNGADGIVDVIENVTFVLNTSGRPIQEMYELDNNGDGVYDNRSSTERTYDASGRRYLTEASEGDSNGDGSPDNFSHYVATYDAFGNATTVTGAYGTFSPPVETRFSRVSTYDAFHNQLTVVTDTDTNGDGTVDSRNSLAYGYDADGREISMSGSLDTGADGSIESTSARETTYGAAGELLEIISTSDGNADGNADFTAASTTTYIPVDDGLRTLAYEYFGS